jgi:hypothetical protein
MHFRCSGCSPQQIINHGHRDFRRSPEPPTIIDAKEERGSWLLLRCYSLFLMTQNIEK